MALSLDFQVFLILIIITYKSAHPVIHYGRVFLCYWHLWKCGVYGLFSSETKVLYVQTSISVF